jgi:hypothetical protein
MIVLGGPIAEAGEPFLREVRDRHSPHGIPVSSSTLGRAGLTGSVLLAMELTQPSHRLVFPGSHHARSGARA